MSGQVLSLNQIFLLSLAQKERPRTFFPLQISASASILKLVFASGKKITPMIAITAQGLLYSIGSLLGGRALGPYLGASLAACWAFIQPLLLFLFLSGGEALSIVNYYDKVAKDLAVFSSILPTFAQAAVFFVSLKVFLGLTLVFVARHAPETVFQRYLSWTQKSPALTSQTAQANTSIRPASVLRDLVRPFYLLSIGLISFYHWQAASDVRTFLVSELWLILQCLTLILLSRLLAAFFVKRGLSSFNF